MSTSPHPRLTDTVTPITTAQVPDPDPIKIQRGGIRMADTFDTAWFCDTAKGIVSGHRVQEYGTVVESFKRTAALWTAILGHPITAEQVAMCQVALKLSRLANTPNHRDSWVDVLGYGAIGGAVAADHDAAPTTTTKES